MFKESFTFYPFFNLIYMKTTSSDRGQVFLSAALNKFLFCLLVLENSSLFSSVAQSCPTLWDPMACSTPGFPVHHQLPEHAQIHVCRVGDAIQPSHPCRPLLLLASIFSRIRVFSSESVLHISKPKYQSSPFSISLSNEDSGLISFRID